MSGKVATPKAAALSTAQKKPAVSKEVTKKAPATATKSKMPKTVESGAVQEKKAKKTKPAGSKIKLVRDSFSMPKSDYEKISELKQLCLKEGIQVKKNQLLRAGLHALQKMTTAQLKAALSSLDKAPA